LIVCVKKRFPESIIALTTASGEHERLMRRSHRKKRCVA